MSDKTIVHSTYYNPMEANIIKSRLEDSGFACFLADENVATLNPLYNQAIGGVKLIVFEKDVMAINELLAVEYPLLDQQEFSKYTAEETDGVACEKCGSLNVSYGIATQDKHSFWVKVLALILLVLPFFAKKCYHCYDCGYEFK